MATDISDLINNAKVETASMMPISQNLATIFASGMAWTGLVINAGIPSFW